MGEPDGAHPHGGGGIKLSAGGVGLIVVAVIAWVNRGAITAFGVMLVHALAALGVMCIAAAGWWGWKRVQRAQGDEEPRRAVAPAAARGVVAGVSRAGEIEPPRETHTHNHYHFGDAETAAAVIRAMQEPRP